METANLERFFECAGSRAEGATDSVCGSKFPQPGEGNSW